jgi:uncharacterized protein HemY
MIGLEGVGRLLLVLGALVFLLGLVLTLASRIPYLGRLPGDIIIQRDNFTLFIPLATMVLLSLVLTILLNILPRLFR